MNCNSDLRMLSSFLWTLSALNVLGTIVKSYLFRMLHECVDIAEEKCNFVVISVGIWFQRSKTTLSLAMVPIFCFKVIFHSVSLLIEFGT